MSAPNKTVPVPPAPPKPQTKFDDGLTAKERAEAKAAAAKETARLADIAAKEAAKEEAEGGKVSREDLKASKEPFKVRALTDGIFQGERKKEGDVFVIPHGGKFGAWMEKA